MDENDKTSPFFIPEAYKAPTLYANKFHFLNSPVIVKIVVGEETIPGDIAWRVSVAMPPVTAKEFVIKFATLLGITADDLAAAQANAPANQQ